MKHNLVIDLSIFIHANYYIVSKFAEVIDEKLFMSKIVDQLNNIVFDIQKTYPIGDIVVCIDSNNFRVDYYPEYKAGRNVKLKPQLSDLKEYCAEHISDHFECIRENGLEADDLMYLYSNKYKPCIIASNDNDCKLMITENVIFYKYREKQYFEYSKESIDWYKYHKVLFGDAGDNVPRLMPKGHGGQWMTKMMKKHGHKKQSEFYSIVSKEHHIPMAHIMKNIHLTNYSMKIYRKFVPNIDEILESL